MSGYFLGRPLPRFTGVEPEIEKVVENEVNTIEPWFKDNWEITIKNHIPLQQIKTNVLAKQILSIIYNNLTNNTTSKYYQQNMYTFHL